MRDSRARSMAAAKARVVSMQSRPINNIVACLGDSRFDYGLLRDGSDLRIIPATQRLCMDIGAWLEAFTGQRIQCPPQYNFGVAGYKTSDILNNTAASFLGGRTPIDAVCACPAASVFLLAGTNDRGGANMTLAQSIANMTTILDRLYAVGKTVFLFNEWPRDGIDANPTQPAIALAFARWLKDVAFKRPGVVGIDAWPYLSNTTSTDNRNTRNTLCFKDGAHPSGFGSYMAAKAAAPAFNAVFPPLDVLATNAFDVYDATSNPAGNLLSVGMMAGTSGTVTNGTGQVANGWTGRGDSITGLTIAWAKATLADGYAAQQLSVSGTPSDSSTGRNVRLQGPNFASSLIAGDVIECLAMIEVDANPGNYNGMSVEIILTTGSGTTTTAVCARDISSTYMPTEAWKLPLRTSQIVVPSGLTTAVVNIRYTYPQNQAQALVARIGRVSVRKVASA